MTRFLLLTLLNLSLPFLMRALYIYLHRLYAKRTNVRGMKDITPARWHFPVVKLLLIGLGLLALSLLAYRLSDTQDESFTPNDVRPSHYTS